MSNNYQKAVRGCLYALAVVIAGVCFSVKPAQSATCFLPSGNCSTGKIGGGPAPEATPEYCTGYNISQYEYNKKYNNTSCFSCTSCTKTVGNKETVFKCDNVEGSNWSDGYHTCCTDNTSFDIDEGACCPAGGCKHDCPTGKSWSKGLKQCVCPSDVETDSNGNCCASDQVLDNGSCTTPCEMNACDGYTYTTDPGNSEKCDLGCNKGYRYKCKSGYTYSNGKCVLPPSCPTGYSTKYQSVDNCGTTGAKGYDFESSGTLNGKVCGKCIASNCEGLYFPGLTAADCKSGEEYKTNGRYDGEEICGLCSKKSTIIDIYITAEEYRENGLGYYYLKASEPVHTNLLMSLSVYVYHDERGEDNGPVSSSDGCQMQVALMTGQSIGDKDRCSKMIYNYIATDYTQFGIDYKDTAKPEWDNKVIDGYRYHWQENYEVVKPTITITLELDGTSSSGSEASTVKFTNTASDGKSYTVKLIIDGDGDNGINYPLTVTQGSKVTYSSRYYETSDCDAYGDCRGDEEDREWSSDPTATSVMVNGKTVLSGIATIDKLAGKSFSTSDYIIKFVYKEKEKCTPTCTSETNCQYGSKTESDGCGGTCTVCYPACKPGYWYGQSNAKLHCDVRPITGYLKQTGNPNCLKCICNGSQRDPATGKLMPCAYI